MSDRATWLAARRKGIGGSDAAAVAGVSPWSTALDVYLDKLGEAEEVEETVHMRRGTLMEPVVRQLYADETGRSVETSREIVQNPRYPFALANLDGIASGDRILECKSSLSRVGWGDPGTGVVPVYCLCQVQHYMMVTELEVADVAVIFGDFEFCIYPVEADLEFQELLAACEHQFWGHVQKRQPPDPQNTAADIKRRWPRNEVAAAPASELDIEAAKVLITVKGAIKRLEAIKERAEMLLKRSIKDADGLRAEGDLLCTWKETKVGTKFDAKRFQAAHPDLYDEYLIDKAATRRFLLKGNAKCLEPTELTLPASITRLLRAELD